ncbi:SDR family oxidoreductase [Halovulum dunhuangense]|uniref:SDR family oxidoreductase n=1 Tax=Halovulum dunhuangense TaxID=1505036 RepID=A0A849L4V0_9RHOB|nr:SDR family oxidoreductase [Halovulum dunhuangense]NNU81171.1 SDR family oxidoreductase [Halovulum dunhuangense]
MGRTAVVTGAGSGLGMAVTRLFLEKGWNVALLGRRAAALEEVAAGHANALCLPCDVSQEAQVDEAFAAAAGRFGRVDMLFNNAGNNVAPRPIDEIPVADWLKVLNVNLHGAFLCARAAFRQMRAQDPQGGRIINNGSISAHAPRPMSVPYTTTKHAITGLTRTLSLDGRRFNIACGQIDIGNALTEMAMPMTKGVMQADGTIRAEATMDPGHVASSVLYMAELPLEANVQFMTVMATAMPFVGRG